MQRLLLCSLMLVLLAGCGTMKGQQTQRSFLGASDRAALTANDNDYPRSSAQPRESFFRRVLFGRTTEK